MANENFERDVVGDLAEEASAIGQLARDDKSFIDAYEAFRSLDAKAFQAVLERLRLIPQCHLICEWIRSKECVFLCLELCGPPRAAEHVPNARNLAEMIVRMTSDDKLVKQLASVVEKRDHKGFERIAEAHKLGSLCHLFCHWVCVVRYRLVCRWICSLDPIERPDLASELRSAGQALRLLLEHGHAFDEAVAASNAGDAEKLGAVIRRADLFQYCHFICEWFCSWRCTLGCFTLCRHYPFDPIKDQIREALAFAEALQDFGQSHSHLEFLSVAVGEGAAGTYDAILRGSKLRRFCIQLCHWICALRCRRFCIRVCPPRYNHPWFTHVGDFGIYADFTPATGLTNKSQAGHGGPGFGFSNCLSLRGLCPKYDPANLGQNMAYRFLYQPAGAPNPTPITGGFVCEVLVGSRYTMWNGNPSAIQSVRIRGTGTTSVTPPPPGPGPTPPDHFIVPDAQGWVVVDTDALDDGFNGWLMGFASAVSLPGGNPVPGILPGTAVPVGNQKNGVDTAIIFQASRTSTITNVNLGMVLPDYTNQLAKIRINNWDEVYLLDLQEFQGPGATACSPLTNNLHVLYTTDHELMAAWSVSLVTSAMIPGLAPVFPSGLGPRGGAGSDPHNITTWPSCSYLVTLNTLRSLTNGLNDDSGKQSIKTFCIGKKNGN